MTVRHIVDLYSLIYILKKKKKKNGKPGDDCSPHCRDSLNRYACIVKKKKKKEKKMGYQVMTVRHIVGIP